MVERDFTSACNLQRWRKEKWVFHKRHIMPEKLMTVLFYGAERADFAIWIISLFVMEMYLLVHKNGHS